MKTLMLAVTSVVLLAPVVPMKAFAEEDVESPRYRVTERYGNIEIRQYPPMIVFETAVQGEREQAMNQAFQILAGYIFGGNTPGTNIAMTAPVIQQGERIPMTAPVWQQGEQIPMTAPVWQQGEQIPMTAPVWQQGERIPMTAPVWQQGEQIPMTAPVWQQGERIPMDAPVWSQGQRGYMQARYRRHDCHTRHAAPVRRQGEQIPMTAPVTQSRQRYGETDVWRVQFTAPAEYTLETLPRPNNPAVEIKELPERTFAAIRFSGTTDQPRINRHLSKLGAFLKRTGRRAISAPITAFYDPPWTPPAQRRNEIMLELPDDQTEFSMR